MHWARMAIARDLGETLAMIARAAAAAQDQWWIIGSAAVVLHGHPLPWVKDVDLLMSARDARAMLGRLGLEPGGAAPSARFRSAVFGIWQAPPVPVEIMGGLEVATAGGWRRVAPATREEVTVAGARVHVPGASELRSLLRDFGRPKDLDRLRLMRAPPASPSNDPVR